MMMNDSASSRRSASLARLLATRSLRRLTLRFEKSGRGVDEFAFVSICFLQSETFQAIKQGEELILFVRFK